MKIRGRDWTLYLAASDAAPSRAGAAQDYTLAGLLTSRGEDAARNAIAAAASRTAAQQAAGASRDEADYLAGRRSFSIPIEAYYDPVVTGGDGGLEILSDSIEADGTDSIYWLLAPDGSAEKLYYGRAIVTELSITGEDDAAATYTATLTVLGAVTITVAPGPPRTVTISTRNRGYDLAWVAPTAIAGATITGYRVRRRTAKTETDAAGDWAYKNKAMSATTDRQTGLDAGKTYDVQIRSQTADAASPWSENLTVEAT